MDYDPHNPFALILRDGTRAQRVHEDAWAIAFAPLRRDAPVHLLVVPRGPYVDAAAFHRDAGVEAIAGFWRAVAEVACRHAPDGHRIVSCNGIGGGQDVFHFHVHVLGGRAFGRLVTTGAG